MVLEVQDDVLLLNQGRQSFNIIDTVVDQLARLHLSLIEEEHCAVEKSAHQSLFHLVGIVVLPWSEPGA